MAWPSTKATTTSIDQGTDNPNLSRVQIKQDIDNVNAIVDTFSITSPAQGDALAYNGTAFSNAQTTPLPVGAVIIYRTFDTGIVGNQTNSFGRRNQQMAKEAHIDPYSILTFGSDDRFKLGPGVYTFEAHAHPRAGHTEGIATSIQYLGSTNERILFSIFDQNISTEDLSSIDDDASVNILNGTNHDNKALVQQVYFKTLTNSTNEFVPMALAGSSLFDATGTGVIIKIRKVG